MPRPVPPLWSSLALDRNGSSSLQDQIVAFFREGVLAARFKSGARVPSSRQLAAEHGIARITAVQAYERLVAEGYLVARRGAGLFVAESVPEDHLLPAPAPVRTAAPLRPREVDRRALSLPSRPRAILPLMVGIPALDQFPWADWARITAKLHRERPLSVLGYGDPRGEPALREAIADYLGASRGVACAPEQILVVAGSQQGLDLAARVLTAPGDAIWVEEPGYPMGRVAFEAAGLTLAPVPVDGEGLDVAVGIRTAPQARLALVSPSHQYPLGATMSLRRRLALLEWAESANGWIIEDDYDGEYRFSGRPLAPLYTLDHAARVLYLGTFSKVLAPGLRLGYLVVPPDLAERFAGFKAASDRHEPGLIQHVVARFIAEGRFAAHLRRMRTLYARRRAALLDALAAEAAGLLDASNAPECGLHFAARLRVDADDEAASRRALEAGRVYAAPLSSFYRGQRRERGFVLGFTNTAESQMRPAIRHLARAIAEAPRGLTRAAGSR